MTDRTLRTNEGEDLARSFSASALREMISHAELAARLLWAQADSIHGAEGFGERDALRGDSGHFRKVAEALTAMLPEPAPQANDQF
jgi:hypothetical protein